jgi:predicted phosphate transport protein (TIGR00153 family)
MSNPIYSLFGKSPVKPLQKHMAKAQACVSQLVPFFDAVVAEDWQKAGEIHDEICNLENKADDLKVKLRLNLPSGLFMSMSRRDLLEVLNMQDKIANKTKDISGLILGRKMYFPESISDPIKEFVARCVDASNQAEKVVNELDELVETGFRGAEVKLVKDMIHTLDRIESDTDTIQVDVRAKLFAIEKELPPVDVMFLYRIIEWIGDLGDIAQRVGSRLQLMLAK